MDKPRFHCQGQSNNGGWYVLDRENDNQPVMAGMTSYGTALIVALNMNSRIILAPQRPKSFFSFLWNCLDKLPI